MTPPRWVDEQGRERPTRPCPRCQRVIPIHRWPAVTLRAHRWSPYGVATYVTWCGHQPEVILVPLEDGRFGEVPVLGEPT